MCEGEPACELVVEVDYQRVVPPIKGSEQTKESQEARLRKAEEEQKKLYLSHDLLNKTGHLRGNIPRLKSRISIYLGGVKGAGCRKSDATSRSAVSSVMSSLKS